MIPLSKPSITRREEELVLDAIHSGWVSSAGPYVDRFEQMFAKFCGTKHALAVSSGTAALHLSLVAMGIGPGDEVIVPDLTFVATANAVHYTGATVVLADVDPDTLCIDPDRVLELLTPSTKAIIVVHLYGRPADMAPLRFLAREYNLKIIEDAAEAHGAKYEGQRVGGVGDCGCFSFYGNKIVTTGEGGMITTNDTYLYERAKHLRGHAMSDRRYWHEEIGFNYRMTNIQAALGCAQMEQIDTFLWRRRKIMREYERAIEPRPGLRLNNGRMFKLLYQSAIWMVCLEYDGFTAETRDQFIAVMAEEGVETRPYFTPLSSMPMYAREPLPVSTNKSAIGVNLPTYFDLTGYELAQVSSVVNRLLADIEKHAPKAAVAR